LQSFPSAASWSGRRLAAEPAARTAGWYSSGNSLGIADTCNTSFLEGKFKRCSTISASWKYDIDAG
jgi:hypothetical protein